jgi:6-bladed beta-propeller protein
MTKRILAGIAVAMLSLAFTVTLTFAQTEEPPRERPLGPGRDCSLSKFCGVPYEYVPDTQPKSGAPLTGDARLRSSGAKLVNGVARQVGGQIGWGVVCYGSPVCAWGIGRGNINHAVYKPDLGYAFAYPLKFPEETTGGVSAVATNSKDHVYAFVRNDPGKPMIFEWDENHKLVNSFGADIAGKPHGMIVDADDNIWICDQFGDTVIKLSPEGKVLMTVGVPGQRGDWNEAKGQRLLWQPLMFAFGAKGDIYIGMGHGDESPNDGAARVLHLDKDGKFINQWYGNSVGPGKFGMVHGIAVNPNNGNVYIADREEYRLVVYDANGKFVKTIQTDNLTCALYVDRNKQLWMATGRDGQIVKLDWDGKILGTVGGAPGKGPGQFVETSYMGEDIHGNIYVADTTLTRVTEFVAPNPGR